MRYENEICPKCGNVFSKEDDIVVCPQCGTPHHRACYLETGHCCHEDKHDSGYTFSYRDESIKPEKLKTQTEDTMVCPICKHENPCTNEFCDYCGQKFTLFGFNVLQKQTELEQDEKRDEEKKRQSFHYENSANIMGISADDIGEYTRMNASVYLKKFDKIANQHKKFTWNWAAFIFGPYWFFYRKMIKSGIIFLMTALLVGVCFTNPIQSVYDEYDRSLSLISQDDMTQEEKEAAFHNIQSSLKKEFEKQAPYLIAYAGISMLIRILAAILADKLYLKRTVRNIQIIQNQNLDNENYHIMMFRVGSVAPLLVLAAYFGQTLFSYLVSYVINL